VAQYGKEDTVVKELLQRYDDLSPRIHVEQVDPVLRPDFLEKYAKAMETNSVIVATADRFKIVSTTRMYVENKVYTEEYGYIYDSYFSGEEELTGAISYVTSDVLPKLYNLTGHGETELPAYIKEAIARENVELNTLNLSTTGSVPEDADMMLLYAPQQDLLEQEAELLLDYLKSGGRLMVIGAAAMEPWPNFDAVMAYYGAQRVEGMVMERSAGYFIDQYPAYVLANIADHTITKPLISRGYFALMPMSQGLVPTASSRETIVSAPLLYTTESALSVTSTDGENTEALAMGPFTLGLAIEEEVQDGATRLLWYTSPYLLQDDVNELSSGANYDLFLNSLSWLYDFDEGISVRSKNLMMDYLTIRSGEGMVLGTVMTAVIPAVILILGGVVLVRRRRR